MGEEGEEKRKPMPRRITKNKHVLLVSIVLAFRYHISNGFHGAISHIAVHILKMYFYY